MRSISSPANQAEIVNAGCVKLSKEIFGKPDPSTIWFGLVAFTLANFQKVKPLFEAQVRYCVDEGLATHAYWASHIQRQMKRRWR